MRIQFIFALLVALLMFGCKDTADEIINGDEEEVVIVQIGDASGDEPVVVSIPKDALISHINYSGESTLALSEKPIVLTALDKFFGFVGISTAFAALDCSSLGSITGGEYEDFIVDGNPACFDFVEYAQGGNEIYVNYHFENQDQVLSMMSVSGEVTIPAIIDASGDFHTLPGKPIKKNMFKNSKVIEKYNGHPAYINHLGKLVRYDLSNDTEGILVDQVITNFSIKEYSNGTHFIVDDANGVKRIKPDQSEDLLPEITPGNWHDIGGSVQYATGTKWMRMVIDPDGNITDRVGRSDPEAFQAWIIDVVGIPMPTGVLFGGSVNGCIDEAVGDQRIMICSGKAFRVGGVMDDLGEIDWCDYGHCGLNSWLTIKSCASTNYVFFYGEDTLNRNRLTWINNLTGQFRDILDTHQISDLECVSDSEIAVVGTIDGLTEALSITGADTISPNVSVIDSQITDIITQ